MNVGPSFVELNGVEGDRRQDIYVGPLEHSPPAYWSLAKLVGTALVVAFGGIGVLAGLIALGMGMTGG